MHLSRLDLRGFRHLEPLKLDFEPGAAHVFYGGNAQGKTSVLEAIYLLALSKSFRADSLLEAIGFEEPFLMLSGQVLAAEGEPLRLEVGVTREPLRKSLRVNGVPRKAADFVGTFKTVLFSPEDILLVSGEPPLRRRYLDVLLSQGEPGYLADLLAYQRFLSGRNGLLRRAASAPVQEGEWDFWEKGLSETGFRIVQRRAAFLESLNAVLPPHYARLSSQSEAVQAVYKPSLLADSAGSYREALEKARSRDTERGSTGLGPHRDDVELLLHGRPAALYASRGEWRSLVLALKWGEAAFLTRQGGEPPVFLLDDVFSELDAARQEALLDSLKGSQAFITTTHLDFLPQPSDVLLFSVEKGSVTRSDF